MELWIIGGIAALYILFKNGTSILPSKTVSLQKVNRVPVQGATVSQANVLYQQLQSLQQQKQTQQVLQQIAALQQQIAKLGQQQSGGKSGGSPSSGSGGVGAAARGASGQSGQSGTMPDYPMVDCNLSATPCAKYYDPNAPCNTCANMENQAAQLASSIGGTPTDTSVSVLQGVLDTPVAQPVLAPQCSYDPAYDPNTYQCGGGGGSVGGGGFCCNGQLDAAACD